ncbi:hypothetical protein HUT19_37330 [Streptomyces sp. NA02950]|uniref:hypothetical protein n=1 Tax=Streptomyces sp. NA02950 TaxID=2742137 RepID=UPI0015924243|nr:hypothetical protein [Streptomyces sp. NA02950]QKV96668.1 hypothetical protein HUT19_37330 [Streptomyces sp. NA02950]
MNDDRRREEPGEDSRGIPRDLPDQQAQEGPDPLDVDGADPAPGHAEDVPDLDESGTGRRGEPRTGSVHPEQPVPDEPSG